MTSKLSSLFSIGEDFDDEDVLGTDWPSAAASSGALRASSAAAHQEPQRISLQPSGERRAGLCNGSASRSSTHTAAGQTVALGLRELSSSSSPRPPTLNLASRQSHVASNCLLEEFDDWDVDLADLDECEGQIGQLTPPPRPAAAPPSLLSSAKTLRPSTCGGTHTLPDRTQKAVSSAPSSSSSSFSPRVCSSPQPPNLRPSFPGPGVPAATPPAPATLPRNLPRPPQPQKTWTTPRPSPQTLFQTVSPAPASSSSSSVNSSALSPHPLRTPVLTNRLVQLVSASTKLPRKRPRPEPQQRRTRLFPGPAGLLPQQPLHQNLDQIVVSAPQTPAHGCVARLPSQGSSSQSDEEEFGGGAWEAMKAETGLDERNPSCFLHSYSVVMVLRKAALKQLARNKVPNMAVLLKSIIHTHADAKAVFKDPTGEIQGTVHRRLLEDAAEELKVGSVLLLKQVGVFSPSHRNHYLNVTPNNLLRVYGPDGVRRRSSSSSQLPPLLLEPVTLSPARPAAVRRETISCMQLAFDEEEEEEEEGGGRERRTEVLEPRPGPAGTSRAPQGKTTGVSEWDADDDLDELMGELPEDSYFDIN